MGCSVWVLGLVALVVIGNARSLDAAGPAMECGNVVAKFDICKFYLSGLGPQQPSFKCCVAAQSLDKIASASDAARKAYCKCVQKIEKSSFIDPDRLELLPQYCRLSINVGLITPNFDCNKF